jgi:putative ABC transport system ATP-binding protein
VAPSPRAHFAAAVKLDRLLSALGLEHLDLDRPMAELSTGERQRLALVRALADDPPVLLLDEPTSALGGTTAALTCEFIKFQILAGRIVILVSHDAMQIDRLATARLQLSGVPWPHSQHSAAA